MSLSVVAEQPWFWPQLDRSESEAVVGRGAHGCFVVRPSSKPGCFALTFKARDDGSVNHTLIFEKSPAGFALEGQQLVFPNVHALLLALSLQRNNIAWEARLFNTDRLDDIDALPADLAAPLAAPPTEPLYAAIPFVDSPLPSSSSSVTASAAPVEFTGSMVRAAVTAAQQESVSLQPSLDDVLRDRRLLNGIVTVLCSLSTGGEPIECQFAATASGKQVKAALIDCAPSLLAFQPRDLELEIACVEPRIPVSDFERFVELSEAVLDAYFKNEPIACFLRVPQVDAGDFDLAESPLPSPRVITATPATTSTSASVVAAPVAAVATTVVPDALEAAARTKAVPRLPSARAKPPPEAAVVVAEAPVAESHGDVVERAHTFELRFVGRPVECHECKKAVWGGRASEIYVCAVCSFSCHKTCVARVEATCSEVARLSAVLVELKPTTAPASDVVADAGGGALVRQPQLRGDMLSSGSVRQRAGWLVKRGGSYKSWKRRWCVVRRGELLYYKDRNAVEPLHTISFVGAKLNWPESEADSVIDGRKHCFTIDTDQRKWCFQAASAADLRDWLDAVHAHVQHAQRLAAAAASPLPLGAPVAAAAAAAAPSPQANSSGALFDVGLSTIGTDAGSEVFTWDLNNLLERRVPQIRWPAGAAYGGTRLRHPGVVFGLVRKLSGPAWADVDKVLQRSGSSVSVAATAPPFRVAVIESPDTQYFRAKMQQLLERQLDQFVVRGARCVPARQVAPSSSALLRDTGTIVRVSVQLPAAGGGTALVQLSVPIQFSASHVLALAVGKQRVGGASKRHAPVVRATSMAVLSTAATAAAKDATLLRKSAAADDTALENSLFGVLGGERTSDVDKAAARELVLRVPDTDEYVLHDDMPLCALQYTADFFERFLGGRELTFVAVHRQWLLDNVDADDRALLTADGGRPQLTADAARDMLALSLDDAAVFDGAERAAGADARLQRQEYMPASACDKMFELRVIAMEHFSLTHLLGAFDRVDVDRGNILMYVELGLFYGDQLLCPKVYTHPIATPAKPYWNEWLICAARVRDLRRETRAVLTFYAYNERKDVAVSLGWVAMPVFDHSAALRQGIVRLGMWSQTTANPLVLTDNAAADSTLAAIVTSRMPADVVPPRDWFGCGARLFAAAGAKAATSQRSSQRTPAAAATTAAATAAAVPALGKAGGEGVVRLVATDEEFDAAVAAGAVGCRRCRRIYPLQADVDFHNKKRHESANSGLASEAAAAMAAPSAAAAAAMVDDVSTDQDAARHAEETEQEARYMRISVQLPRLPVPVAHESTKAALDHVLGGGATGNTAQWKAEADAAPEQSLAERSMWRKLVAADPLYEFSHDERRFVWKFRGHLLRDVAAAAARANPQRSAAECEMCATGRNAVRVTLSDARVKQLCGRCVVAHAAAIGLAPGAGNGDSARAIGDENAFSLSAGRAAWLVVRTAPWHESDAAKHVYSMLRAMPRLDGRSALALLDSSVVDEVVRAYAVACIAAINDTEYRQLLLPLVAALKYERSHWSPLAHWLLMRALANRRVCGAAFFWTLRAELHRPVHNERLALLLEAYLAAAGAPHCDAIYRQCWLDVGLHATATLVRRERDHAQRTALLRAALAKSAALARTFAGGAAVALPTDAHTAVRGIVHERCRWLQSFTVPLWLELNGASLLLADAAAASGGVRELLIYKAGDDLRQDALTLLALAQLNRVWQLEGLDMRMTLYDVLPTGGACGFIQVVPNTKTTAELQQAAGGVAAVFRRNVIADWLRAKNEPVLQYKRAVDNFMRSCAAYAVATYMIGIQDRHNDNIMVAESGHLLHIDFAHFLGNVMKFGAFNREKAPFVFTPAMAYVMGDETSPLFADFVALCCRAFNAARRHAPLFFGLFQMMLHADIPQLESRDDLQYLRKSFALHLNDRDAAAHFAALLRESLSSSRAQINGAIHILAKRRK